MHTVLHLLPGTAYERSSDDKIRNTCYRFPLNPSHIQKAYPPPTDRLNGIAYGSAREQRSWNVVDASADSFALVQFRALAVEVVLAAAGWLAMSTRTD